MFISDILQNAPFRSQIFKFFFASGGKGSLIPLTKIPRTFVYTLVRFVVDGFFVQAYNAAKVAVDKVNYTAGVQHGKFTAQRIQQVDNITDMSTTSCTTVSQHVVQQIRNKSMHWSLGLRHFGRRVIKELTCDCVPLLSSALQRFHPTFLLFIVCCTAFSKHICLFTCGAISELSMGPFCVTRSNPTHQLTDPTQPNTTNNGGYSSVVTYFYTHNLSRTFSQPSINLFIFFTDH